MKSNRKLQLLTAATVAMLAINPAARAQTPAPLSDEMLLHAMATGQIPTSQLGAGGGDDENVANRGTASINNTFVDNGVVSSGQQLPVNQSAGYGGGIYLQGQTTASQLGVGGGNDDALLQQAGVISVYPGLYYGDFALQNNGPATAAYGGAMYYGGGVYNNTAGSPPVNSWYNDFYGNVSAPNPNSGFKDSDGSTADLHATTTTTYGGGLYLQGQPTVSYGGGIYNTTAAAAPVNSLGDVCDLAPALQSNGPMTVNYGGAAYLHSQPTAFYGGAIYHSTASSLYGEDLPGSQLTIARPTSLYGEDLPGDALYGEDLPGEALTDAQLDALILQTLTGFLDQDDNCPVAPMGR